uniref:Uncharacterized protein n=1 Tax=Rhizophora mucronata TaxID=61149 RepID=A0A2P2L252_RHIMU
MKRQSIKKKMIIIY